MMDSKDRNTQMRQAGIKKSLLRLNLERVARNSCEPPLPIYDMNLMTNDQLIDYISKFKMKEESTENLNLFKNG